MAENKHDAREWMDGRGGVVVTSGGIQNIRMVSVDVGMRLCCGGSCCCGRFICPTTAPSPHFHYGSTSSHVNCHWRLFTSD